MEIRTVIQVFVFQIACDTDYKLVGNAINCKAGSEASGDLPICLGKSEFLFTD